MDSKTYREVMGERLHDFRVGKGLSAYAVAKRGGIRIDQVTAVESGASNYTIDVFLGYVKGCDLYLYFADKTEGHALPHDFEDIARQGIEHDPER